MGQSLLAVNLLLSLVVFVDNDDFALLLGSCCLFCFVLTTSFASAVSRLDVISSKSISVERCLRSVVIRRIQRQVHFDGLNCFFAVDRFRKMSPTLTGVTFEQKCISVAPLA